MMGHNCLHYAVLLLLLTSAILVWVVWQLEVTAPMCGHTSTTTRTTITTTRTKVLLLAYSRSVQQYIMFEGGLYKNIFNIMLSRSGSSLLGELLSLSPATSYYYEPLRQHNLTCAARHNR